MAINLEKGQRVNVELPKFVVALGWDNVTNREDFDLDVSVFVLGANKKILNDNFFVFYNNLVTPDGAVEHTGDNLTGQGDGDDESIKVDLSKLNEKATEICFVVTIHNAASKKQNFGQIVNSFVRIYNPDNNEEILKYELTEDFSIETAVEFGRLYKKENDWKFEAIGVGQKAGLEEYLNKYN